MIATSYETKRFSSKNVIYYICYKDAAIFKDGVRAGHITLKLGGRKK
jgi:hypothetical protein